MRWSVAKAEYQSKELFIFKINPSIQVSIMTLKAIGKHLETNHNIEI